jgi:hypothetical protein
MRLASEGGGAHTAGGIMLVQALLEGGIPGGWSVCT